MWVLRDRDAAIELYLHLKQDIDTTNREVLAWLLIDVATASSMVSCCSHRQIFEPLTLLHDRRHRVHYFAIITRHGSLSFVFDCDRAWSSDPTRIYCIAATITTVNAYFFVCTYLP